MHEFLNNFLRLYSDDQQEVYKAFLEKKDWILEEFYIPGDFSLNKDEKFEMLDAVLEDNLYFKTFNFTSNDDYLVSVFNSYLHLVLYKEMKKENQPFFWVKYDFSLMSKKLYQALAANIYPRLKEDELEFNHDFSTLSECLKLMMIGEEHERVLIVAKSDTVNHRMEAPKLLEIIVHIDAPKEVKDTLKKLALVKNAIYKEEKYEN